MPVTRSRATEMEETLKQLMGMMQDMKNSQDEMKEDLKKEMKNSQDEMKEDLKKEMKNSQEEVKNSLEEMKNNQEELRNEMKTSLQENNKKLEEAIKVKLNEFEETVEEEINQLRNEVQDKVQVVEDNMTKLQSEVSNLKSQLSAKEPIKTESSVFSSSRVKPPTFDGKVSWSTYLKQFEAAALANNWSEEEKATSLIVALRGEAMEILRTLADDKQKDYQMLKGALEMRYGDAHLQHVYQAQLKGRRQRFEENLQQFEADIARMVKLAYPTAPTEFQEQLAISSFIDGLRDSEISQALRLARHKNISEALAQALEIEAARQASRNSQGRIRQVKFQTSKQRSSENNLEGFMKSLQDLMNNFQQEQDRTNSTVYNRRRPIQCWNCGAEGHLRNRCPKNTSSQDQENAN